MVQWAPKLGRHEGLDAGQLRGLNELELPAEPGAGHHADDGVNPCTSLRDLRPSIQQPR